MSTIDKLIDKSKSADRQAQSCKLIDECCIAICNRNVLSMNSVKSYLTLWTIESSIKMLEMNQLQIFPILFRIVRRQTNRIWMNMWKEINVALKMAISKREDIFGNLKWLELDKSIAEALILITYLNRIRTKNMIHKTVRA